MWSKESNNLLCVMNFYIFYGKCKNYYTYEA
jgi:hypothetical protein